MPSKQVPSTQKNLYHQGHEGTRRSFRVGKQHRDLTEKLWSARGQKPLTTGDTGSTGESTGRIPCGGAVESSEEGPSTARRMTEKGLAAAVLAQSSQNTEVLRCAQDDGSGETEVLRCAQDDGSGETEVLRCAQDDRSGETEVLRCAQDDRSGETEVLRFAQDDKLARTGRAEMPATHRTSRLLRSNFPGSSLPRP